MEILKLLYRDANILILDEPTAVLTPQETEQIFSNLRRLREEGKTILIITHKLREVLDLTDEVTVFRAGRVVGSQSTKDCTEDSLAEMMVGRKISLRSRPLELAHKAGPLLDVESLSLKGQEGDSRFLLHDLSFSLRPGEILGIAGVQGNGQHELQRLLLNPRERFASGSASGKVELCGRDVTSLSTAALFEEGLACITDDRLKEGLIPDSPLSENFALGLHRLPSFSKHGRLEWKKVREGAQRALKEFSIRAPHLEVTARALSGGNQQKLIIARELVKKPKVLIAAEPTRGVDIGAIEFIHEKLRELQRAGAAVLLISSDLSEIMSLSNRILVLFDGRSAGVFDSREATEQKLGLAMGGLTA